MMCAPEAQVKFPERLHPLAATIVANSTKYSSKKNILYGSENDTRMVAMRTRLLLWMEKGLPATRLFR
jgi:hypothetical protein